MAIRKDHSGIKYNHLTMVRPIRSGGNGVGVIWEARCDCGTVRELPARRVSSGEIQTCGKCKYFHKLKTRRHDGRSSVSRAEHRLFQRCLRSSLKRGIKWDLSLVQFRDYIHKSCDLCGAQDTVVARGGKFRYNYLERWDINSKQGIDNSMVVCSTCREFCAHKNPNRFYEHILRVVSYLNIPKKKD